MPKKLIWVVPLIVLLMGMAHQGGVNTYQGLLSEDGKTLVVVDTRTGGYKVRRVAPGVEEKELFDSKERHIQHYQYDKYERND